MFPLFANEEAQNERSEVGFLDNRAHGVVGRVYAESNAQIAIDGFSYDGAGPGKHIIPTLLTYNI